MKLQITVEARDLRVGDVIVVDGEPKELTALVPSYQGGSSVGLWFGEVSHGAPLNEWSEEVYGTYDAVPGWTPLVVTRDIE